MNNRAMVDSGIEWIGEIPNDWNVSILKNITHNITSGRTPLNMEEATYNGDLPWITISDMSSGFVNYSKALRIKSGTAGPNANIGAVLYSIYATIGIACGPTTQKVATNQAILAITPKNNAFYFRYCLEALRPYVLANALSNTQANLSLGIVRNFILPTPPLSEQQSIANFLNHHVNLIDREATIIDKKIELLSEKRKALIFECVTGKRTVLQRSSFANTHDVVGHGDLVAVPTDKKDMIDSGVEWIGEIPKDWEINKIKNVAKVNPKTILPSKGKVSFIPMEKLLFGNLNLDEHIELPTQSTYTKFSNGDLLVAKVTPCFENGKIAVASNLINGCGLGSSEITPFRTTNIDTQYLKWFMQSDQFINAGVATMNGTAGLQRVSTQFWTNCPVTVPQKIEQEIISKFLDTETSLIDQEISLLKRKKELLIEKRKALIFEAVTGKIDCRSWIV